jgi:uncharacterized protein YecE (DUF72 family)
VPADFRFAVKLRAASATSSGWRMPELAGAPGRRGQRARPWPALLQTPPSLALDLAVAGRFFTALRARYGGMVACEARHPSWFGTEGTALLQHHGLTRVIADPPAGSPGPYVATTVQAYVRLHGSPRIYYSAYGTSYLRRQPPGCRTAMAGASSTIPLPAQRCTTLNCKKYNAALKNACKF